MSTKSITSTDSNKDVLGQFGQMKSTSAGSFGSADDLSKLIKPVLFRSASLPSPKAIKYSPQPDLFGSPATSNETPASDFTTKSSTSLSSTSSIPTEQVAATVAEPIPFGEHVPTCYFSEPHLLRYTAKLNTSSAPHIDMQEKIVQQLSVDTSDPEEEAQEHNLAGIEIEDDISDEEPQSPTYAQQLPLDFQIKANVGSGAPMVHNCCKNGVCNVCMPVLKGTTFTGRPVAPSMDAMDYFKTERAGAKQFAAFSLAELRGTELGSTD